MGNRLNNMTWYVYVYIYINDSHMFSKLKWLSSIGRLFCTNVAGDDVITCRMT